MSRYVIEWATAARKQVEALETTQARRVARAVGAPASDPRPSGSTKLAGGTNAWRIRVGDWRVVYVVEDARLLVLVVRVAHRRGVYR